MTGKNSPSWRGGRTEKNKIIRSSIKCKKWRLAVLKRDNFICRCCNTKINIQAHHIKNFSSNEDLRFELDNGIVLCKMCHVNFHNEFGYRDNNNEQLIEFMNKFNIKLKEVI